MTEVTRERLRQLRIVIETMPLSKDEERDILAILDSHLSQPRTEGEPTAVNELRNIANAKRFDRDKFDDDTAFADWAQSRARHTMATLAQSPQPPAGEMGEIVEGLRKVRRWMGPECGYSPYIDRAIAALTRQQGWPIRTDRDPPEGDSSTWILAWLVHESTPPNWFQRSAKVVRGNPQTYPLWMPWPPPPYTDAGKGA